jgi:hypothetical protein
MTRKCNPLGKILQEETPYKMRETSENDEGKGRGCRNTGCSHKKLLLYILNCITDRCADGLIPLFPKAIHAYRANFEGTYGGQGKNFGC